MRKMLCFEMSKGGPIYGEIIENQQKNILEKFAADHSGYLLVKEDTGHERMINKDYIIYITEQEVN